MAIEDKKLLEAADKFGVDASEYDTDEDLKAAIDEKEAAIKKEKEDDLKTDWKEKAKHNEEEAKKAFAARDQAKKERRTLQAKVKSLEELLEDAPSPEDMKSLKDELKGLKQFKVEFDKAKEEEELKNKNELEKAEIRHKKELEGFQAQMDEAIAKVQDTAKKTEEKLAEKDTEIATLRESKLRADIIEAAGENKAYKPSQIFGLLRDEFTFDPDLGKFVKHVKDSKGKLVDEMDVVDRVKEFLEDPDNDNLVKSDVNPDGTGHRDQHKTPSGEKSRKYFGIKSKKGEYDPTDEMLKAEADEKGLSVEDLIDVKKMRDAKMAKVRGTSDDKTKEE